MDFLCSNGDLQTEECSFTSMSRKTVIGMNEPVIE